MSLLAIVKTKDNNCNNIYLQIIKYMQSDFNQQSTRFSSISSALKIVEDLR